MIFWPINLGIDGFDGWFALAFFWIVIAITAFVMIFFYRKYAKKRDEIIWWKDLLAHRTYSIEEWEKYTKEELQRNKSEKKILFLVIAWISLVAWIWFAIYEWESWKFVLLVMLWLVVLIWIVAFLSVWSVHKQNKKHLGQVYITKDGIILNRQLHVWNILGNKLENVEYKENKWNPYIDFLYSAKWKNGRNTFHARIPVPTWKEDEAKKLSEPQIFTD